MCVQIWREKPFALPKPNYSSSLSSSESASASHLMNGSEALRTFLETSLATYCSREAGESA